MAYGLRILWQQAWGEPVARFATEREAEAYWAFLSARYPRMRSYRIFSIRQPVNAAMVDGKLLWVLPRGPGS